MWVSQKGGSAIISCRVQPNSAREGTGEIKNDAVVIRLNAPAVEGKANDALIKFLSKRLGISKSKISIIRGGKSRNKLVAVEGLRIEEIEHSLKNQSITLTPR
ncbi:MAG: DUF167 domain-containing protein [Desulfomonilia bacterium]|jgi:hypothetical protein